MIVKKIEEFKNKIENKQYFEAHEVLEEVWFPKRFEDNKEIKLIKGFINASVSFELKKRGREKQSKRVWANYLKYRQYLYKIDSKYINEYNQLIRYLDIKNLL